MKYKFKKFKIFLILCFFLGLAQFVYAEVLTLNKAFEIAIEKNPSLSQARAYKKQSEARVVQAISAFLPKVNLELGYTRSNNPVKVFSDKLNQADFTLNDFKIDVLNNPDYRSAWQARIVMLQPIFNQGREFIGYKTSRLVDQISSLMMKSAIQAVLFNVEKAYCQVLLAKDKVEVLKAAHKTATFHAELAQKRYDVGLVLKSDVLSAQVYLSEIERELFQAKSDYNVAMAALNTALGEDQQKKWTLKLISNESKEAGELDKWIEKAKKHRPEYLMAKNQLDIARYGHKQAIFHFLPSFNLQGIYQTDRENLAYFGGDSWTFMATMSMNLFNGFGDKALVDEAIAKEEQAQSRLKEVAQRIELEVRKSFYAFETSQKQLKVAQKAVQQAKESQKILKNRYENGLALMVELLAADTSVKKVMLQEADARFKARLAWSDLMRRVGILGESLLKKEKKYALSER